MTSISALIPYSRDCGPRDHIFGWVLARYALLMPEVEVVVGNAEPWNVAAARNDAFRRSTGDILMVADADTIFHSAQIYEAVDLLQSSQTWVLPYGPKGYYNLSEHATKRILAQSPKADIPEPTDPIDWEFRLESWAGLAVMHREAYGAVRGYDEGFEGWGYEDNAHRVALDTLWGPFSRLGSYILHLWHPVSVDTTWGQPHIGQNRARYMEYLRAEGDPRRMKELVSDHLL